MITVPRFRVPRFLPVVLAVLAMAVIISAPPAFAQAQKTVGKVYLMRGLANVFSYGLDDLSSKLRAKGIDATVYEYPQWESLAADAVAWSKAHNKQPVVIVGHSLGADSAVYMAERMTALGVPPRLVITFDPVGVSAIGPSGGRFINYFQSNNGFGKALTPEAGFRGKVQNIDLQSVTEIDHFNIEKSPMLHDKVVNIIYGLLRVRPAPAPVPAPAAPNVAPGPAGSPAPPSTVSVPAPTATAGTTAGAAVH